MNALNQQLAFDNIPRLLILGDHMLREHALKFLREELNRANVRRPWGSIEPFIVALHYSVFIEENRESGVLLYKYINKVLPSARNTMSPEAQTIADLVLLAVCAKLGECSKEHVINKLQSLKTSSSLVELARRVILMELEERYDESINDILNRVLREERTQHLRLLSRDIIEHFFVDLDRAESEWRLLTVAGYFTRVAEEYVKRYEAEVRLAQNKLEELRKKFEEEVTAIANKVKHLIIPLIALPINLFVMYSQQMVLPSSILATSLLLLASYFIKRARNVLIENFAYVIARRLAVFFAKLIKRKLSKELEQWKWFIDIQKILIVQSLKSDIRRTIVFELSSGELQH